MKLLLDCIGILALRRNLRSMRGPILQQHRNRCRSATFNGLLDERNVEPDAGLVRVLRLCKSKKSGGHKKAGNQEKNFSHRVRTGSMLPTPPSEARFRVRLYRSTTIKIITI